MCSGCYGYFEFVIIMTLKLVLIVKLVIVEVELVTGVIK